MYGFRAHTDDIHDRFPYLADISFIFRQKIKNTHKFVSKVFNIKIFISNWLDIEEYRERKFFIDCLCVCVCVDNYCHDDDKQIGFKLWEYYVDDYGHGTNLSYWNFSFFFWKLFNIFHCSFQCPKMYYSIHSSYMKNHARIP